MVVVFRATVFALVLPLVFSARVHAAFGVTSSGGLYTVDTGAELVFKVSQSNGDITSLVYNGVEYDSATGNSQVTTGLGAANVTATTYGTNYIMITCSSTDTNVWPSTLTQYYMVRNGVNNLYLATHPTSMPTTGTLRWITRTKSTLLSNGPAASDNRGNIACLENCPGGDVFLMADGTTRSKYYDRHRVLELDYNGATGAGVGLWMAYGNRESSSGGPFYRDTENQCDSDREIYNVMFSNHEQPESVRLGVLHGPYALVFNNGTLPAQPLDFSWIESGGLNLLGWVASTNRGAVTGIAWGIPAGFQGVVKFANTNAQYWAVVGPDGTYVTPLMKPGDYTAILCKGELEVATNLVTVVVGQTNLLNLASSETAPDYIFKLGEWDGTPRGFLNGDKITYMHPSDVRMSNWNPGTIIVGVDPDGKFPMAGWKDTSVATNIVVQFVLAANQIQNLTLRYGITATKAGGRPKPQVNAWLPGNPAAPTDLGSRNLTLGTYRGINTTYNFTVPANQIVIGTNTLTLFIISGSTPTSWLSPSCVYDAVELDIPNTAPALPAVPGGLSATALNGSQIKLAWADTATNEVNFLIERSTNGVNFGVVAALLAGITNYTDASLASGTTNYYRLRTFNAGGYSGYSATSSAITTLPRFTNAQIFGSSFILTGTGGPAGGTYFQLTSSNVALPLNSWAVAATNVFDASGSFVQTNLLQPGAQYFRLKIN